MSMVLEYVIKALLYLAVAFAGVWLGNLLMGTDHSVFTIVASYIIASGLLIFSMGGKEQ